jgi:hypothetical protein
MYLRINRMTHKNEQKAGDYFLKKPSASKKPITAIKHSYRNNDIDVPNSVHRVEAGGFEPPSRDISGRPSTCVVVNLRFAPQAA